MRALAIDPDRIFSRDIVSGLGQEGFLVDRAGNLQKAVWMARTIPYDLIFLNFSNLAKLIETVRKLAEESPSAFLVAMLPYVNVERRVQLFDQGLDEIIIYPCYFRELLVKIRGLTRREKKPPPKSASFRLDNLEIEPDKFLVRRGSREIYLCRKEFDLLYFLFRHQGKVLSKIRILEGVWDSNSDALTNTLEVHILKLRRKIGNGAAGRPRLIHTVYGRGYLFGLRSGAIPTTGTLPVD